MRDLRMFIRRLGLAAARSLGTEIKDHATGRSLGRAVIFAWRGRIHVIGLETPLKPHFLPQKRLTYWRQEIGFTVHPRPDFPSEPSAH